MQDRTDCFKLGKTIYQYKQLCCSISPASSTSSLNEHDCSDIEQYDEESSDDETEIAELTFESQDLDFRREHSVAHELFRTETKDKPILKKPISFELFPHVGTPDQIQKLSDFARDADLDIQTLLEEQLNVLYYKSSGNGTKPRIQDPRRHQTLTIQKPCYHITTSSNNSSSNPTLTSSATENQFRTLAEPR